MTRNNSHAVTGFIQEVLQKKEIQGKTKTFEVQEFILKTEEDYPQPLKFEIYDERIAQLDGLPVGQAVEVLFSQRGREYQGKYYNSNRAYKVDATAGGLAQAPAENTATSPAPAATPAAGTEEEVPF